MHEVSFLDGTAVPDDYLALLSPIVRDAAVAIGIFGEDELEAACQATAPEDAPVSPAPAASN
jgi:hypothetical protein